MSGEDQKRGDEEIECSCEYVDIGIGWQKVAADPDCPKCAPNDEWERALAHYAGRIPKHGRGSLPHGYAGRCDGNCNNIECPMRETHERCTIECLMARGPSLLEVPVWRDLIDELSAARYAIEELGGGR